MENPFNSLSSAVKIRSSAKKTREDFSSRGLSGCPQLTYPYRHAANSWLGAAKNTDDYILTLQPFRKDSVAVHTFSC